MHHGALRNTADNAVQGASAAVPAAAAAAAAAAAHTTKHFLPPIPPKSKILRRHLTKERNRKNSSCRIGGIRHHHQQQQEEQDHYINIKQILGSSGALGGQIWGSASSLCRFIANDIANDNAQRFGSSDCDDDGNDAVGILNQKNSWGERVLQGRPLRQQSPRLPIVELGSGTGAVGIWASIALGRHVILTEHRPPIQAVISSVPYSVDGMYEDDLTCNDDPTAPKPKSKTTSDRLLRLLQENIELNFRHLGRNHDNAEIMDDDHGNDKNYDNEECPGQLNLNHMLFVRELDWKHHERHCQHLLDEFIHSPSSFWSPSSHASPITTSSSGFDCIIGSDLTYDTSTHHDLARTISTLLARNDSYNIESDDTADIVLPTCWIAHQPRVYGFFSSNDIGDRLDGARNEDIQLQSFRAALESVGLTIVKTHTSNGKINAKESQQQHNKSLSTVVDDCPVGSSQRRRQSVHDDKVLILEIRRQGSTDP